MAFGFTSGGLAGAFGHPEVSQFIDPRRNMLLGLAAGLVGGPNWSQGLSSGFQMAAQGGAVDRAAAEKAKADELAAKQTAAARTWFEKNAPQYVPMIDAGMSTGDAWNRYFQGQNKDATNPYMSAGDGKFFNWQTGQYVTDPNAMPARPAAPSGYQWKPDGTGVERIPGMPPEAASRPTDADVRQSKLSSVVQGDKALLLGDGITPGKFEALADFGSQLASTELGVGGVGVGRPGMMLASADYQQAYNALTNIAQSYLYAISGQAAPAGEVAKIVDSVTPKIGESEASVKAKKQRLAKYIEAIELSKADTGAGGNSGDGWTVVGVE